MNTLHEENNLTIYSPATEMLHSQWGFITCAQWCALESRRMNRNGAKTTVHTNKDGLIAVIKLN